MQRIFHFPVPGILGRTVLAALIYYGAASAATLQDFGFESMNVNAKLAIGTRPLLLIVASFAGETNKAGAPAPLPHDTAYYDNLVFSPSGYPSVSGYFSAVSNGRFSWTRAGVVHLDLPQSAWDSTWPGPGGGNGHDRPYMSNIVYQAMASGQFNFKAYDANGDGQITQDELGILVIGNDFTGARYTGGPVTSPDGSYNWGGKGSTYIATVKDNDTPFITICEEFEETLGCVDIYGDNCWNYSLTPQSCEPFYNDYLFLYYLDPWQRMCLGWCSPRIESLPAGGVVTLSAAQAGDPASPVILYDPAHGTGEFWILEYRTPTSPSGAGYDANVAYATSLNNGLAVWHIQQDSNHQLITTVSNQVTLGRQQTDWNEGPPNLDLGSSALWGSDTLTPRLTWLNDDPAALNATPTTTHVHVRPFSPGAGSITVEWGAEDIWVDFTFTGSPQSGTFANPFKTMAAGLNSVAYGGTLHLKTGSSSETPAITKRMNIVGYNGPAAFGH